MLNAQNKILVSAVALLLAISTMATAQDATPVALNVALQTANPGDIVDLGGASGFAYLNQSPNQLPQLPGSLVYSDDPETVNGYGILYRSTVPAGPTRVYIYHVNNLAAAAKMPVVLQNTGANTATIQFTNKALPTPSGNYILTGKRAVQQYYENTSPPADITIPPGGSALMDSALDSLSVSKNQLVNGIYEFTSSQPLTITTLMLATGTNTLIASQTAATLPGDGFNRQGTFPVWAKANSTPFAYTTTNNIRRIVVGNGSATTDPAVAGYDEERHTATTLPGNFGVTYIIKVNVASTNNKRLALLLNPRGGGHAGYVRTTYPDGAQTVGSLVPNPTLNLADSTKAIVCGKFTPTSTPQTLTIEYMPPGASSLPVSFMLVPISPPSQVGEWGIY